MMLHSIVIPVFNEREGLAELAQRLKSVMQANSQQGNFEVILVNDGSSDGSAQALDALAQNDRRFKILHLSRNFGHQAALTAGLEWAQGNTVTVIDADLQDPPELIAEFLVKWQEGFEVVYAVRNQRAGETFFKLLTAKLFYRLIRKLTRVAIPVDTGDFRLLDRKALDAFLKMPERHRFIRGMISWVGFKQTGVLYDRASRKYGETHYPFRKMLKFALDGVTSFSIFPLQLATYLGVFSALLSFVGMLWALYIKFFTDRAIQGWTSLMVIVTFLGGAQLLALGVIGEYLGRTYDEARRRPLYFISKAIGFEKNL